MEARGLNCSTYADHHPDPDIAGIGVIIGFLGPAWLVVFILVIYYVLFYNPTIDPFSDDPTEKLERPNSIDMLFYNTRNAILRRLLLASGSQTTRSFWRKLQSCGTRDSVNEVVMSLSDLQIVSGIAILTSGYYEATRGLSGYHWKMIVRVAWFSTITHLAAVSCLRTYLHQTQVKRLLRLILMGILAVMVITATLAAADTDFDDDLPAICFLQLPRSGVDLQNIDVLSAVVLLLYNILLRVLKLHKTVSKVWDRTFREIVVRLCMPAVKAIVRTTSSGIPLTRKRVYYILNIQPLVSALILGETYYLIYTSTVAEVYWLLVSASWGSLRLFDLRMARPQVNSWGFSQIMPVVLFLGPLLVLIDTIAKPIREEDLPAPRSTGLGAPAPDQHQSQVENDASPLSSVPGSGADGGLPASPPTPGSLLDHIQNIESGLFSIVSFRPLAVSIKDPRQPFLGFPEYLPCFPYLTLQLCTWIFFLHILHFLLHGVTNPLRLWFGRLVLPDSNAWFISGYNGGQSPMFATIAMLPWIFLFGPTASVPYVLLYPRNKSTWYRKLPEIFSVLLEVFYAIIYILFPIFGFLSFRVSTTLWIWGTVVLCYMTFTPVYVVAHR